MAFRAVFSAVQVAQMTDVASGLTMITEQINGGNWHPENNKQICRNYTVPSGFQRFWTLCKDLTNINLAKKFSNELRKNEKNGLKGAKRVKPGKFQKARKGKDLKQVSSKDKAAAKRVLKKAETNQKELKNLRNNMLKGLRDFVSKKGRKNIAKLLKYKFWFTKPLVDEFENMRKENNNDLESLVKFVDDLAKLLHDFVQGPGALVRGHLAHGSYGLKFFTYVDRVEVRYQKLWEKTLGLDYHTAKAEDISEVIGASLATLKKVQTRMTKNMKAVERYCQIIEYHSDKIACKGTTGICHTCAKLFKKGYLVEYTAPETLVEGPLNTSSTEKKSLKTMLDEINEMEIRSCDISSWEEA